MVKKLPPKYSYQESIEFVEDIRKKVGNGALPIDDLAKNLGFAARNSGEFPFKMAAARQFGLLSAPAKSQIQISQFFKNLKTNDVTDDEIRNALLGANYYQELGDRFEIPVRAELSSISTYVETTYDIRKTSANKIARAFQDSMEAFPFQENEVLKMEEVEENSKPKSMPANEENENVKSLDMLGFHITLSVSEEASLKSYDLIEPLIRAQIVELVAGEKLKEQDV